MPSLSTRARIASLAAFAEAREIRPIRQRPSMPGQMQLPLSGDNCGTGSGGFKPGNQCQGDRGSTSLNSSESEAHEDFVARLDGDSPVTMKPFRGRVRVPGMTRASSVTVKNPREVAAAMENIGLNTKQIARIGVAEEPDAKVVISSYSDSEMTVLSTIPYDRAPPPSHAYSDGTGAKVKVSISKTDQGVEVDYGNFSISGDIQAGIAMAARVQAQPSLDWSNEDKAFAEFGRAANTFLGGAILGRMGQSLIEAEAMGAARAETYAAGLGRGDGRGAGAADTFTYKGYSLWVRFGFDGKIPEQTIAKIAPILDSIYAEGESSLRRGVLSEDGWSKFATAKAAATDEYDFVRRIFDSMSVQDIVETKQGERLWRDHGRSARLILDFRDKESKGYKKFQEFKSSKRRARLQGSERQFYEWLWETEFRESPELFFRESRNCGTGAGGFQKGNTCSGAAADVAASAAKGAITGAAAAGGKTAFFPPTMAAGAAVGAAAGVVTGLYDASMSPTRAGKAITAVGSSDDKVAALVKGLGGSPQSVATSKDGKRLSLNIKNSKGESSFTVEIDKTSVTVTPSKGTLTDSQVAAIRKTAEEHAGREVTVNVDKSPASTMAKLAKAGFKIGMSAAGAMAAGLLVPMIPAVAGTAIEATGVNLESSGILKPLDRVFGV